VSSVKKKKKTPRLSVYINEFISHDGLTETLSAVGEKMPDDPPSPSHQIVVVVVVVVENILSRNMQPNNVVHSYLST